MNLHDIYFYKGFYCIIIFYNILYSWCHFVVVGKLYKESYIIFFMVNKKQYNLYLDEDIVNEVRIKLRERGAALSPVLNILMMGWLKKNKNGVSNI